MNEEQWVSKNADRLFAISLKISILTILLSFLTLLIPNEYTVSLTAIALVFTAALWVTYHSYHRVENSVNRDLAILDAYLATGKLFEIELDQEGQIHSLFYLNRKYFANIKDRGYSLTTIKYKDDIFLYKVWFDGGEQGIYVINEVTNKDNNYALYVN
jgi:hypothetical protein